MHVPSCYYMSAPIGGSDDWKTEYDQLSEDYRHYVTMGWQATVAVLLADGVVLGLADHDLHILQLCLIYAVAGALTIMMGIETLKWTRRGQDRINRLREIERQGFRRFSPEEHGFRNWGLGYGLFILMMIVGCVLAGLSIWKLIGFVIQLMTASTTEVNW